MPRKRENAAAEWSLFMQEKLDANTHKKHWSEMSSSELWPLLLQEMLELRDDQNPENVMFEAADVSNLAFMYAERRKVEMLVKMVAEEGTR